MCRGKKVKVFLCGDYEFLCRMFGLSGASGTYNVRISVPRQLLILLGRHCCLWCLITQEQLKLPPSTRGPVTARTTKSISEDYEKFQKAGANPKMVKHYNNCVNKPFFPSMPLSQVCTWQYYMYLCYTYLTIIRCAPQDCTSHWAFSYGCLCSWKMRATILTSQQS